MSELTAALATIEKFREITNCPEGVGLQDHLRKLVAERDASLNAERVWEKTMMEVCGEDGPASVASEIRALRGLRDTAMQALKAQVEQLAAENVAAKKIISECREYFIAGVMNRIRPTNEGYLHMICDTFADETPATNAAIAGIKADEEKAVLNDLLRHLDKIDIENLSSPWELSSEVVAFVNSRLLREGAK